MALKFNPVDGYENTVVFPDPVTELQGRQQINELHKQTRDYINKYVNYAVDTGTANAMAVSFDPAPTAYVEGYELIVKAAAANTGPTTININGLGAKTIKKNGNQDLQAGDIIAGQLVHLKYDGTYFQAVGGLLGAHLADLVTDADGVHGLKTEMGTWTPTIFGATTPGTNTYQYQFGTYYKIGGLVWIGFLVVLSTKDAAMDGYVCIGGLPFVFNTNNQIGGNLRFGNIDLSSPFTSVGFYALDTITYIRVTKNGDAQTEAALLSSELTNTALLSGNICYRTY